MRVAFLALLVALSVKGSVTATNIRLGLIVQRQKLVEAHEAAKRKKEPSDDEEPSLIPRRLGAKPREPKPQAIMTVRPEKGETEKNRGLKRWESGERPHNNREKDAKDKPTKPPKPTKPRKPTLPPRPTRPPQATKPPIAGVVYYKSTSGIFNVTLPLFSSATTPRYAGKTELAKMLIEVSKFKCNRLVEDYSPTVPQMEATMVYDKPVMAMPMVGDAPATKASAEGVNDFETNNQEANVDESDLLKTNGEYAFAGYGNYVAVWEVKTGKYVTTLTLPPIDNSNAPPYYPMVKEPQLIMVDESTMVEETTPLVGEPPLDVEATVTPGKKRRNLSMTMYNPRPTVQSMLLHGTKLVVIANGYGTMMRNDLDYVPTLYDAFETNVRIYDISKLPTTGEVTFIKETHVHGSFNSARVVGNNMH
jgi:hypothetical protein